MNEITTIIEGYNKEKVALIMALISIEDYGYEASQLKAKDILTRVDIIDKKLEVIRASLMTKNHDK